MREQLLEWRLQVTKAISIMKQRDFKISEQKLHLLESRRLARSTFRQDSTPDLFARSAGVSECLDEVGSLNTLGRQSKQVACSSVSAKAGARARLIRKAEDLDFRKERLMAAEAKEALGPHVLCADSLLEEGAAEEQSAKEDHSFGAGAATSPGSEVSGSRASMTRASSALRLDDGDSILLDAANHRATSEGAPDAQ
jgi:hypothetical protein